jgi:hypothetical protein
MNDRLLPCPSCARHVRVSEDACPFCATALPERSAPPLRTPAVRLGRAALFALGTSAAAIAACGGTTSTLDDAGTSSGSSGTSSGSSGSSGTSGIAAYGGPPFDSGADTQPGPMYGGPPQDAAPDNDSSAAPLYGLPPNPKP